MTKNNKKLSVSLLGVALAVTFTGGFAVLSANADDLIPTATEFYMTPGASARLDGTGEYSGMRFEATVSETWYNEIKTTYDTAQNITFGMLIAPTRNLTNGLSDLTVENVDTLKATNIVKGGATFEAGSMKFQGSITYSKTELEADYEEWKGTDITEEQAKALLEQTYDLELVGRAYCSFTVGETPYTYYAVPDDNERTVREVMNAHDIAKPTDLSESEKAQFLDDITTATAYADLEGDVVFDKDTANKLYVGASGQDKTLDNGYIQWTGLVDNKNVGDTITVSTIEKGKITRINVSVIDEVMTEAGDLTALNNTSAEVNTKKYALGKNLNASAVTMAHDNATGAGFGGLFDGMGHTISNLNIGSGTGFFGEFAEGAVVQNVALYDITVNKGFYFAENAPKYTMKNVYVKLSEASVNPKGISKMTNNQVLENVVVEYTGANAVKVPTSSNSTVWDAYGVLCFGIHTDSWTCARDDYFKDVYVISPSLLEMASLSSAYLYGKNETTDVWGRAILVDGVRAEHTFAEGESPFGASAYKNVPMQNTYHYDDYSAMADDNNDLTSFDSKYWVKINGVVCWKDIYVNNIDVVVTDETDAEIDEYELMATTDEVNVSMVDIFGNTIDGVQYTIANNDGKLQNANGTFTLTSKLTEDKEYDVTLAVVVSGVTIERNITIKALSYRATYAQEVYLATNSNYNGADEYVLTNAGTTMPTGITSATLNGVELLVTDGALPDITMNYYKKFESYGKTRETYMDIWASRGNSLDIIAEKKADQTPLTLTLTTDSGIIEFTNLFVCTDVIETATDLKRFEIRNLTNAETENNDGYYVMTNNINAQGLGFAHQRDSYNPSQRFVGTFDGRGYTVSNLNVDQATTGNHSGGNTEVYGLFGNLYGADIINVGFVNVSAEGGSVLGSHTSYMGQSNLNGETLLYAENIYPHLVSGNIYASTRIENVYIQVADSVTSMKGALCPSMSDYNFLKNIVIEWNPTESTALTSGYGSFIGSADFSNAEKPKKENIIVLSNVQLNSQVSTASGVTVYANREAMEGVDTNATLLANFTTYWTTTSNAPVWNTANWQNN